MITPWPPWQPSGPVLVVTTSYPRWAGDFAGSFVWRRVQQLTQAGHEVQVIAAGEPAGPDAAMSGSRLKVERLGFAVGQGSAADASLFYGDGAPERLDRSPRAWLQALRLWGELMQALSARSGRIGSVESHWLIPSALGVAAAGLSVPHRALAHSGDVALLERLPGGPGLARWLLPRVTSLAFASADLRRRFAALVGGREAGRIAGAELAPAESAAGRPGPRLDPVARQRLRRRRGLDRPVVLAVGRLIPIKGHDLLVRAIARLPAEQRPTLVILGEGSQREALERLAAARKVRLLLPGQLTPTEVGQWLELADLFVHPSRRLASGRTEGAPVALREALAAGVPVVATSTGGVTDMLADLGRAAALVPPDDPEALARSIERHVSETALLRILDS